MFADNKIFKTHISRQASRAAVEVEAGITGLQLQKSTHRSVEASSRYSMVNFSATSTIKSSPYRSSLAAFQEIQFPLPQNAIWRLGKPCWSDLLGGLFASYGKLPKCIGFLQESELISKSFPLCNPNSRNVAVVKLHLVDHVCCISVKYWLACGACSLLCYLLTSQTKKNYLVCSRVEVQSCQASNQQPSLASVCGLSLGPTQGYV